MAHGGWGAALSRTGQLADRWPALLWWTSAAAFLVLQAWVATTRYTRLTHDTLNYADVARHVWAGDGLVQSTLFYTPPLPLEPIRFPVPFTIQPPGFPTMIAALTPLGLTFAENTLLACAVGSALALVIASWLAARMFGEAAGPLAGALLAASYPFARMSSHGWSEGPSLAPALGSLLLLLSPRGSSLHAAAAGLLAGAAFGMRYAMIVALLIGAWAIVATVDGGQRLGRVIAFVSGFAVVATLVLAHNVWATGRLMGIRRPAATVSFTENLRHTLDLIASFWLARDGAAWQLAALLLGVAVASIALSRARNLVRPAVAALPLAWAAAYVLLICALHSVTHFGIDSRIAMPGQVWLMVGVAGGVARLLPFPRAAALVGALVMTTLALRDARMLAATRPMRQARLIEANPGLIWVRENLREGDLLAGWNTLEVGYYLRRNSVSIYSAPRAPEFGYRELCALAEQARGSGYQDVCLMVPLPERMALDVRLQHGDLFGDLVEGRLAPYAGLREVGRVDNAAFFHVAPCAR